MLKITGYTQNPLSFCRKCRENDNKINIIPIGKISKESSDTFTKNICAKVSNRNEELLRYNKEGFESQKDIETLGARAIGLPDALRNMIFKLSGYLNQYMPASEFTEEYFRAYSDFNRYMESLPPKSRKQFCKDYKEELKLACTVLCYCSGFDEGFTDKSGLDRQIAQSVHEYSSSMPERKSFRYFNI